MKEPKLISAEERAAQIWCEPIHSHKVMDADMAFSIAEVIREREAFAFKRGFETAKQMAAQIFAVRSKGYDHVLEQIQALEMSENGK